MKFFLFTFAGSMLTFLGLLAIVLWDYYQAGDGVTFSIAELTRHLALDRWADRAVLDLPGAVCRLRHQGAAVSAAHLAAAGPRAGPDRRQRDPGRACC